MTVLETERLILRDWRESDHALVTEIYADEDHARYIGGAVSEDRAWRVLSNFIGHKVLRGYSLFAIEEKATGTAVGWAGPWYPFGWPEQEIGYSLVKSATGKGYAREAARAALAHAYDDLRWETAISLIDARNEASKHVARSLGADYESDAVLFGKDKAEVWRHLPPAQFRERFA